MSLLREFGVGSLQRLLDGLNVVVAPTDADTPMVGKWQKGTLKTVLQSNGKALLNKLSKVYKFVRQYGGQNPGLQRTEMAVLEELSAALDSGHLCPRSFGPNQITTIVFVGLEGSARTLGLNFARHQQKRGWKPALIWSDTNGSDACSTGRENASMANVPFFCRNALKTAEFSLNLRKEGCDLVIVDACGGGHKQAESLLDEAFQVAKEFTPSLVLWVRDGSVTAQYDDALFEKLAPSDRPFAVIDFDRHSQRYYALQWPSLPTIMTSTTNACALQQVPTHRVDGGSFELVNASKGAGITTVSPTQVSECGLAVDSTDKSISAAKVKEEDSGDDDDDDDDEYEDDDDEYQEDEEDEDDLDNKAEGGEDEDDVDGGEEGAEGEEDDGEEDDDEGDAGDKEGDEDEEEEEGEEGEEADDDGDEQEEEDDDDGDQDPEDEEDEEEAEESDEEEQPPKKKRK